MNKVSFFFLTMLAILVIFFFRLSICDDTYNHNESKSNAQWTTNSLLVSQFPLNMINDIHKDRIAKVDTDSNTTLTKAPTAIVEKSSDTAIKHHSQLVRIKKHLDCFDEQVSPI